MNRSPYLIFAACCVALTLALAACTPPGVPPPVAETGGLQISVTNNINARTLVPPIDMTAESYTVTGTGPNSATFTATTTGAPVTENGLAAGSWTIVVNATNPSVELIGTGTAIAQVNTGETTGVAVTVTPISGTGTLSLTVVWPASQVETPSISASLTPALGTAAPLDFIVSGATASYSDTSLATGYYDLAFTLCNNGVAVAGAVDVVRIVADQTTAGTYEFTDVNTPGGTLVVTINTNLQNPLAVSIAGAQATQSEGDTQQLTASVSNYSESMVYTWYVNGASQTTTGSSFTFGSGVAAGYYRIDATVYNADRSRAGAATQNV
ncbi:MAG TPA: hypothetical protein VM182_03190, partial [Terriglobia bacterium]|nr:hypothetical protein [Terriglobia bacterium]